MTLSVLSPGLAREDFNWWNLTNINLPPGRSKLSSLSTSVYYWWVFLSDSPQSQYQISRQRWGYTDSSFSLKIFFFLEKMKLSGLQQCPGQRRSYLGLVIIIFDNNIIIILLSASIISLAMLVGSLLGGYCGGRFGPRLTTLLTCLPSALGWLTMALSPSLALLLLLLLSSLWSRLAGQHSQSCLHMRPGLPHHVTLLK